MNQYNVIYICLIYFQLVIVGQTYYSYFTTTEEPLKKKLVTSWTSDDVQLWLKSLDRNTQENLAPVFRNKQISEISIIFAKY